MIGPPPEYTGRGLLMKPSYALCPRTFRAQGIGLSHSTLLETRVLHRVAPSIVFGVERGWHAVDRRLRPSMIGPPPEYAGRGFHLSGPRSSILSLKPSILTHKY
jgi:hypothetical protein